MIRDRLEHPCPNCGALCDCRFVVCRHECQEQGDEFGDWDHHDDELGPLNAEAGRA